MKRLIALFLILAFALAGCTAAPASQAPAENPSASTPAPDASPTAEAPPAAPSTRVFVDSAGREVEIPAEIHKIAPSGPLAQIVLYTACPDLLAGLASDFSNEAKEYIDQKYWGLPKFGQFYGKNASLNMEALVKAAPDVIIDIGEPKDTIKDDMDALQEQLGIPTVFIKATLNTMPDAYSMLGELTGETERAAALADYCRDAITIASDASAAIPDSDRVGVFMAMGDAGLNTNARGSFHAEVIDRVGTINIADVKAVSTGGGSEVSFEQILKWNPEIIIADTENVYKLATTDAVWKELDAVKNGRVYKIPTAPYSFISNPPSVNRIIGIKWLGKLAYPEKYDFDLDNEVKTFYKLFYSIDLNDEQLASIMEHAE